MADKEVIDNELIDKFNVEDTIFNNCMNDFSEFPAYISEYDDIEGHFPAKHMDPAFRNLNLDSIRQRKNGELANFEHHSIVNDDLMRRNYNYIVTVFEASKRVVEPFIFNTAPIPFNNVVYVNDTMFFNPKFFNTCEIRGIVNLNNLRYKIKNKEELTQADCLDLIWLVKTSIDICSEDLIHELTVDIWAKAVAPEWMLRAVRKNLLLWAGKYLMDVDKINEFKGAVKMSKTEEIPFEQQIINARIAGALERAEENGLKEGRADGLKEGHANGLKEGLARSEKIISKLLETQSPEEISREFDIPIEDVVEIKNGDD